MSQSSQGKKSPSGAWWLRRILLAVFDILALNLGYFLALIVRFYVNGSYRAVASDRYIPAFLGFAPWYTIAGLLIFALFRLYTSRWREAGLNDLNRIFFANVITTMVYVAGTLIFFTRMPISVYVIGALIQFAVVVLTRFSYRILSLERLRLAKKSIRVMIVGAGETGRILRHQMDTNNLARPVVIFSYRADDTGMMDGIPVVGDVARIPEYVKKYEVSVVVLADSLLPPEVRKQIRDTAGVEVQDFCGYLTPAGGELSAVQLLEYVKGPVTLNGTTYRDAEDALAHLESGTVIRGISGNLSLETEKKTAVVPDTSWSSESDISFF